MLIRPEATTKHISVAMATNILTFTFTVDGPNAKGAR